MDSPGGGRDNPRPMRTRPFFALLAASAMLAPASCHCTGDSGATGTAMSAAPTASAAPEIGEQAARLANGLSAELVTGPCGDSAAVVVLLPVGIDHDPPGRSGLVRLLGRLLATAAPAGGPRTVETGNDSTLYAVTTTGDQVLQELDGVARWLAKPPVDEASLARERAPMLEELGKLTGTDAAMTALSLAEEGVAPTRGNGKRRGVAAEVSAITVAEAQAFWEAHFAAGNARLWVAGRYDTVKTRAHLDAAFGSLAAGKPPTLREPGDASVRGTLVMGDAPTAVAIAVPAPAPADPLHAPFVALAARILEKPSAPRTWEVSYDPLKRPDLLFVTGPVGQAEQPEPAAGRMRDEVKAVLSRPLDAEDIARARRTFPLYVGPLTDPAVCAADPRAFAAARARRTQLGIDGTALEKALESVSKEQLEEAAKLFEVKKTAAVIAGGKLP